MISHMKPVNQELGVSEENWVSIQTIGKQVTAIVIDNSCWCCNKMGHKDRVNATAKFHNIKQWVKVSVSTIYTVQLYKYHKHNNSTCTYPL